MVRKHLQFALVFGSTLMATFAVFSVASAETATPAPTNPVSTIVTEALALPGRIAGGAFGATIGTAIVTLCGWLMVQTSTLFSFLIEHIIVDFGTTLNTLGMTSGINTVWTAFRDFGNILIIGMFTFVAIGTILGIEQYGARKMIARVLIVAILINFSLLFTKLAIDASNFVAHQFYKAASFSSVETSAGTGAAAANTVEKGGGIGALFLTKTGVGSVYSNIGTLGWAGLSQGFGFIVIYTFTISAFFLILAGIFLYGSLLIISRAFVLVILMITSAAALASSLVPAISSGKFSWKAWLDMLLKTSLFAPVLMIMLWGALVVLSTAPASSVSLADYVKDPTNPNAWTIIFMYMFTAGLLFIAIKAASSLSTGTGLGFIAGLALGGFGRVAGFALRNTVGRGLFAAEKSAGKRLGDARRALSGIDRDANPLRYAQVENIVQRLAGQKRALGWGAKQDFNLANSSAAKWAAKQAGLDLALGEKKIGGFAGSAKKRGEAAAEQAESLLLSKGDKKKIREEAQTSMTTLMDQQKQNLAQQAQQTEQNAAAQKQLLQQQKQVFEQQARATEQQAKTTQSILQAEIEDLHEQRRYTPAGGHGAINAQIAQKQGAIAQEDTNIEQARQRVKEYEMHLEALDENVARDREKLRKHTDEMGSKIAKHVEHAVKQAEERATKAGSENAARYGSDILSRYRGKTSLKGHKAQDIFDEKHSPDRFKKDLEKLIQQMQEGH